MKGPLQGISDHGYIPVPPGCRIEQLAIQLKDDDGDGKRYLIDEDYWKGLDNDHRAGLILHEITYREAISLGAKDSIKTRYYTALISSLKPEEMSVDEYE